MELSLPSDWRSGGNTPGIGENVADVNTVFGNYLYRKVAQGEITDDERRDVIELAFTGSVQSSIYLTDHEKSMFKCANEIALEWHIRHQSAFQEHTDNAVSKTINLPNSATVQDVQRAYALAIGHGLKGITVFRDGCLQAEGQAHQAMSFDKKEAQATSKPPEDEVRKPVEIRPLRPQIGLSMKSLFGTMHLHITVDPQRDRELEVFGTVGKAGDIAYANMEGLGRLISTVLRLGGSLHEDVIGQLKGIGSKHTTLSNGGRHLSLEDTLARALEKYLAAKQKWGVDALLLGTVPEDEFKAFWKAKTELVTSTWDSGNGRPSALTKAAKKAKPNTPEPPNNMHGLACPECSAKLVLSGGCSYCQACAWAGC